MKKVRIINICLTILMLILVILGSLYKVEKAEVVDVKGDNVIFITKDGNEWEFYGDGYKIGDKVKVYFNCKGTEKRSDDIVLNVK